MTIKKIIRLTNGNLLEMPRRDIDSYCPYSENCMPKQCLSRKGEYTQCGKYMMINLVDSGRILGIGSDARDEIWGQLDEITNEQHQRFISKRKRFILSPEIKLIKEIEEIISEPIKNIEIIREGDLD